MRTAVRIGILDVPDTRRPPCTRPSFESSPATGSRTCSGSGCRVDRDPASDAVPEIIRDAAVVITDVVAGFRIVSVGDVVSLGAGAGGGTGVGVGAGVGVGVTGVVGIAEAAAYSVRIAFLSSACSDVAIR